MTARPSANPLDSFLCNKKLPDPSKIRTLILDLHDAIKTTPSSYFKNLQTLAAGRVDFSLPQKIVFG